MKARHVTLITCQCHFCQKSRFWSLTLVLRVSSTSPFCWWRLSSLLYRVLSCNKDWFNFLRQLGFHLFISSRSRVIAETLDARFCTRVWKSTEPTRHFKREYLQFPLSDSAEISGVHSTSHPLRASRISSR